MTPRRDRMKALASVGALFGLALFGAAASCGDWVSLGPLIECGRRCELRRGDSCEFGIAQYNRAGECVCGMVVDCPGYVCEPSPPIPGCYIAQRAQSGACECTIWLKAGTCGQPCTVLPDAGIPIECPSNRFEWNGSGACVCAPAECPCGQPCLPSDPSDCYVLNEYNEDGQCVCAPAVCSTCEENPCCKKLCGDPCSLPGCDDDGEECAGQCDKKSQCTKDPSDCVDPK